MKILLVSCMGKTARRVLEAEGHDVVGVLDRGTEPGDAVILQWAYAEERILSEPQSGAIATVGPGGTRLRSVPISEQT